MKQLLQSLIPCCLLFAAASAPRSAEAQWACDPDLRKVIETRAQLMGIRSVEPTAPIFAGSTVTIRGWGFGQLTNNSLTPDTRATFVVPNPFWPPTISWSQEIRVLDDTTIVTTAPDFIVAAMGSLRLVFHRLDVCGPQRIPVTITAVFASSDTLFFDGGVPVGIPPATVNPLTARTLSSREIELSWQNVAGETGYVVSHRPAGTYGWTRGAVGPGVAHIDVVGLTPGSQYEFMVAAFNDAGPSADSAVVTAVTYSEAPPRLPPNPEAGTVEIVDSSPNAPLSPKGGQTEFQVTNGFAFFDDNNNGIVDGEASDDPRAQFPLMISDRPCFPIWCIDRGNAYQSLSSGDVANLVVHLEIEPTGGSRADQQFVTLHLEVHTNGAGNLTSMVAVGGIMGDLSTNMGSRLMNIDPSTMSGSLTGRLSGDSGDFLSGSLTFAGGFLEPVVQGEDIELEGHTAIISIDFQGLDAWPDSKL